jgi:hypothetical protein
MPILKSFSKCILFLPLAAAHPCSTFLSAKTAKRGEDENIVNEMTRLLNLNWALEELFEPFSVLLFTFCTTHGRHGARRVSLSKT